MKNRLAVSALLAISVFARGPSGQTIPAKHLLAEEPTAQIPPEINSPDDAAPYLQKMSDKHGYMDSGGTCLFYRYWTSPSGSTSDSVLLLFHGIGGHSGNFKDVAEELNKTGITVYALDTRGHGLSCGKRDHLPDIATENKDIALMLDYLRQTYPHSKQYIMAPSLGGVFAINYAAINGGVSGIILISPAVAVHDHQWRQWGTFRFLPDLLFSPDKPAISLHERIPQKGDRNNQFTATPPVDPLSYKSVSINYLLEAHNLTSPWQDYAPRIIVPVFLIRPGDDPIVSPPATKTFFKLLGTRDKELKVIENGPHNLLLYQDTPAVLALISDWILKHSAAETAKSGTHN